MIEEHARVVAIEGEFAWVERERRAVCDACSAKTGCGTATLSRVLGRRVARVRALNRAKAADGDEVVIGISEHALVAGSLALYGVPLVGLLGGAALGVWLGGDSASQGELLSIVLGMSGLATGVLWLRRRIAMRTRDDSRYQPVVLRRVATGSATPISLQHMS